MAGHVAKMEEVSNEHWILM